jgi:hypothetical protein
VNDGLAPAEWSAFFLAVAILGGALAGSIAVALANHVPAIVARPGAVARAAEAIVLPLAAALIGVAGLWPADTTSRIGIAIAVVGAGTWLVLISMLVRGRRLGGAVAIGRRTLPRLVIGQLATLPAIAGGVLLATAAVPGLDPLIVGLGTAIVGGPWLGALLLLDLAAPTAPTPPTPPTTSVPRPEPVRPTPARPGPPR